VTQRPIFVVGTGGLGREMAQLLGQVNETSGWWSFEGFIGASGEASGRDLGFGVVVGDDDWLVDSSIEADLIIGIGNPAVRARALTRYLALGPRFAYPSLIHPSAVLDDRRVHMGRGNVVTAGCVFTCDIEVGDFNLFNWQTTVGHDARIGSYCVLNPSVNISGGVTLGDRVFVGTGAQILENRVIGADATIGAGAVVTRDVSDGTTVVGVPAKPVS
jgi:sugar O-acyltransferase (sialic acid O-acetyltransferase NeuD family)